jgi:uncharacterized protein
MSDRFVKNPLEAVKAGDVLEFRIIGLDRERRRISLSRKSGQSAAASCPEVSPKAGGEKRRDAGQKTGSAAGPSPGPRPGQAARRDGVPLRREGRDDDGIMYNPFAEAFKKMREKKPDKNRT